MLYTTNWIERFNKEVRKTTQHVNNFPQSRCRAKLDIYGYQTNGGKNLSYTNHKFLSLQTRNGENLIWAPSDTELLTLPKTEARLAIFTWIESWYNPTRRHSGLGYLLPNNFEKKLNQENQVTINCNPLSQVEILSIPWKNCPSKWDNSTSDLPVQFWPWRSLVWHGVSTGWPVLNVLDRHKTHVGSAHCFTYRFCIRHVMLVGFHIGLYKLEWHEFDSMSKFAQLSRTVVW